jgi:hypothetical protein
MLRAKFLFWWMLRHRVSQSTYFPIKRFIHICPLTCCQVQDDINAVIFRVNQRPPGSAKCTLGSSLKIFRKFLWSNIVLRHWNLKVLTMDLDHSPALPRFNTDTHLISYSTLESTMCLKRYKLANISTSCMHIYSYFGARSHFAVTLYNHTTRLY